MATKKSKSSRKSSTSKLARDTRVRSIVASTKIKKEAKQGSFLPTRSLRLRKSQILIIGGLILLIVLIYNFRGLFVASTVNGRPITRLSLVAELESRWGKATLDYLVSKQLITQEAVKQNIKLDQKDIDNALKEDENYYKSQGQTLDQVLKSKSQSKEDYIKEEITPRLQLMKMIEKDTKVTEKELDDYIERNKDSFPADSDPKELRESIKQDLEGQKIVQKRQEFLNKLHQDAAIKYYVSF